MEIGLDGEVAEVRATSSDIAPDDAGALSCAEQSDDSYDENDTTMFHDAYYDAGESVSDANATATKNSIPAVSDETANTSDGATSGARASASGSNPKGAGTAQRQRVNSASAANGLTEIELCEHIMDTLCDSQLKEWTTRRVFTEISRKRKRCWLPVEEKRVMDQVRRRISEMLESRVTVHGTYFTGNGHNTPNDARDDLSALSIEEAARDDELSDIPDPQGYSSRHSVPEQSYPSRPFMMEQRSCPSRRSARVQVYPSETFVAQQRSFPSRSSAREQGYPDRAFVTEQRSSPSRPSAREPRDYPNRVPPVEQRGFTSEHSDAEQRGYANGLRGRRHLVAEDTSGIYANSKSQVLAVLRRATTNLTAREIADELRCDVKEVGYELRSLKKAGFGISLGPTKGWLAADHTQVIIRKPARPRSSKRPDLTRRGRGCAHSDNNRAEALKSHQEQRISNGMPGSPSRKSNENIMMNSWNAGSCSVSESDDGQSHRQSIASSMDERKHPLECGDIFGDVYSSGDEERNAKARGC
eukprot:GEMP01024532.1.p1 GENE.GEMP01024532.1~~GEMP01024532.1.p1  ORF type:complete len:529 (+),score=91.51 GEMP01024532.1:240-1826(+)